MADPRPANAIAWCEEDVRPRRRARFRFPYAKAAVVLLALAIPSLSALHALRLEHDPGRPVSLDTRLIVQDLPSDRADDPFGSSMEQLRAAVATYVDQRREEIPAPVQVAATPSPPDPVPTTPVPQTDEGPVATSSTSAIAMVIQDVRPPRPEPETSAMAFAPTIRPTWADRAAMEAKEPLPTATVRRGVNFRATPGRGRVLSTLRRGTVVDLLDDGCRDWCEISVDDRKGYVFRTYLRF